MDTQLCCTTSTKSFHLDLQFLTVMISRHLFLFYLILILFLGIRGTLTWAANELGYFCLWLEKGEEYLGIRDLLLIR